VPHVGRTIKSRRRGSAGCVKAKKTRELVNKVLVPKAEVNIPL
jgi:hypothetical protein